MNIKRILSSALTAVIMFTTILAAFPLSASAAVEYITPDDKAVIDDMDQLKAEILDPAINTPYGTAQERLEAELAGEQLYGAISADGKYTIYANRYTGMVYYVNNQTGQILTSNPYNPAYAKLDVAIKKDLMSQVILSFSNVGSTEYPTVYDSYTWSASYSGGINISTIENGLRVSYGLGDSGNRFLLPECLPEQYFENDLIIPMIKTLQSRILATSSSENHAIIEARFDFLDADGKISSAYRDKYNTLDTSKLMTYLETLKDLVGSYCSNPKDLRNSITSAISLFYTKYQKYNPNSSAFSKDAIERMHKNYPVTKEGVVVYAINSSIANDSTGNTKRAEAKVLKNLCPEYTMSKLEEAEAACGIEVIATDKPFFECAIEYSFNEDGTLSISLPSESIVFDESKYVINSIVINKHFGCGDMLEDGYIFYPDGSGTIVEFSDFYSNVNNERQNVTLSGSIYGTDYAYSLITGAHRENVSLPVYGMVTTTNANESSKQIGDDDKTTGGFFTVIEEGESVTKLTFTTGGAQHKFASIYPVFQPYASDTFDLSTTLSVAGLTEHQIFAEDRYHGNYTMRVKMLTEPDLAMASGADNCYDASYVGMATYYRDYLKKQGVIEKLEEVNRDLPLYVEALGSMQIVEKIMTFPVTVSIPLTRFEDIETMYNEFSDAKNKLAAKAEEYKTLAALENKDANLKAKYEETAAEYARLAAEVQNITNINFRLTGFANGGMHNTYPAKVKWEKACGGEKGIKALLAAAKEKTSGDASFAIFPEFDFLYVTNTAAFDGISNNKHISLMMDNRYASKQVYNNISREFNAIFSLVVKTEELDSLYTKFQKQYSKIGNDKLSVSTLGSDLNSNFDSENVIDREEAKSNVVALLDRMANTDGYELMVNSGNAYALKYATHIIDFSTDSSHFRYSSYSIPFTGMILHSYVNYAGSALNYSGSSDYELLRSIENGAALYYILCYDNTNYMKDDYELSKYYGVDYVNWFASIAENYTKINNAIGHLQTYEIVDHKVVYAERKFGEKEKLAVISDLGAEFIEFADKQIYREINAIYDYMIGNPVNKGRGIKLNIDVDALVAQAIELFDTDLATLEASGFIDDLNALVASYESKYSSNGKPGTPPYILNFDSVVYDDGEYESAYDAITYSVCTDKNYEKTDYTCDLGNVVIVTYSNGTDSVTFILNYNIYEVEVRLESGEVITLGKYEYKEI